MTGKASRAKGHRYELHVVHYLQANGFPEACTTRSQLGHGGTHQPGDVRVEGPVCVSVECKDVTGTAWPTWLRQAARQAGTDVPVVVRKARRVGDVGRHPAVLPWGDYMDRLDGTPAHQVERVAVCRADLWVLAAPVTRWEPPTGDLWAVVTFAELVRAARTAA